MLCVVALVIFGIMGIFSASHRQLAKEAAACVFRRITFRPCNTTFQDKAKGKILGWLLEKSPRAGRVFNKYSEVFAWVLFVLMVGSTAYSVYGIYNFYVYGSCQGLNKSGFCVFDPTGGNNKISALNTKCLTNPPKEGDLDLSKLNPANFPQKNLGAKNKMIFIGCFACDYTRQSYPVIKKLADQYQPEFTFAHLPVKEETQYLSGYGMCVYKVDKEKFWQFMDALFTSEKTDIIRQEFTDGILKNLGLPTEEIKKCAADAATARDAQIRWDEVADVGVYGTPTVFINGKAFVGPKPERVYKRALVK